MRLGQVMVLLLCLSLLFYEIVFIGMLKRHLVAVKKYAVEL